MMKKRIIHNAAWGIIGAMTGVGGVVMTSTIGVASGAPLLDSPTLASSLKFESPEVEPLLPIMSADEEISDFDSDTAETQSIEPTARVFCLKPDWGAVCSKRCMAQDIPCVGGAVHPYKPDAGIGKLFSCNGLILGYMCGYHYDNGDDCYWPFGRRGIALCSYSGNQ